MDVTGAVIPHRLEIEILENVERLQHHRTLHPGRELVDVDPRVAGVHRLLDLYLPVGEIPGGEQTSELAHGTHQVVCDVTPVEALVGGVDGGLATLAGGEGPAFRR